MSKHTGNRLASEKSPYLLQHAQNPVDWFPWGDEAFLKARAEEKPVFLSIGYSTCHWCHVMERESFEDPVVAQMLNDVFVCIKVDREERPDIDGVYMTVCQMMTGSGGWPLTIFLLPDRRPFFAATYIPRNTAYGRTGLTELLPRIAQLWKTRRKDIEETADQAIKGIRNLLAGMDPRGHIGEETIESAYGQLERRFDPDHGGFGPAPKFPSPHNLLFLLRYYKRRGQKKALTMVEKTLLSMRMGGIYDQVGFGFHRYSTDATWLVPHFEKMLYDQALMAMAYGEAYQLTGKPEYEKTLREIFAYVLRDLTSPEGAFYSAEDADSEGVEGKFYLWEEAEMFNLLGDAKARLVMDVFGVKANGNAPGLELSSGKNILYLPCSLEQIASDREMPVTLLMEVVEWARAKLLEARGRRARPLRDEKILTDWNGLMCAALAKGGQILGEETYTQAARRAVDFILAHLRSPEGRLLHRYCDGESAIMGHLDDYAFLIWALLELYEATFSTLYLEISLALTDLQITHFWDEKGGFFFSPEDGEMLPLRQKEIYDGAIPSGNSIAMLNLIRLARLTGRHDLEKKGNHLAEAFAQKVEEFPMGHTQLLQAVNFALGPAYEVILSGDRDSEGMRKMILALSKVYSPNKVVLFLPSDDRESIIRLAPFVRPYGSIEGRATAYVCRETRCELPTTDVHEMIAHLGGHAGSAPA